MDINKLDGINPAKKYTWRDKLQDAYELLRYRAIAQRQRHGDRFGLRTYSVWQWLASRGWFVIGSMLVYTNLTYFNQRGIRDEVMNSIEMNRRRHYGKSFENEYQPYTPGRLYDGPTGYMQVDSTTGLRTNADGKITAPSNEQLAENLKKAEISADMVKGIKELHEKQYAADVKKPIGAKQFTGLI